MNCRDNRQSGYDWIWFPSRLAIYIRDGWQCVVCGRVAPECILSLDHIHPAGGNKADNLVTMCVDCNNLKGANPLSEWRPDLIPQVAALTARPLDRKRARELAWEMRPGRMRKKLADNKRRWRGKVAT